MFLPNYWVKHIIEQSEDFDPIHLCIDSANTDKSACFVLGTVLGICSSFLWSL